MSGSCPGCAELKPRFHAAAPGTLIKATWPFQAHSSKRLRPSTIVGEFSRFPFTFPCVDKTSATVMKYLSQLFIIFSMPSDIHSDRGSRFISDELKQFLHGRGVVTSRTTSNNPRGNELLERQNGIIWKAVTFTLKSRGQIIIGMWEVVLPDSLHAIRSLLCTFTNATPHERLFANQHRSTSGHCAFLWLTRRFMSTVPE